MTPERTVLIVDDEDRNVKLIKAILAPEQYRVLSASNGPEALALLARQAPDIILLDVMMPGMDGFEVCRRIKADEQTRVIPVLMVTALAEKSDWVTAMQAGADDFLSKPIDKVELLVRVKSLIRIKSYHDEIVEKNNRLVELERMKEALTHMVVHDLKNPVTAVSGNIELVLLERKELSHKHVGMLDKALLYCRDVDGMLRNILDIQKMKEKKLSLTREPTDLRALSESVITLFSPRLQAKRISVAVQAVDGIPRAWCDPGMIERVMANLLDNAVKYTPEGGTISIAVEGLPEQNAARFSIRDTGPGIPPEYRTAIFEQYEQVKIGDGVYLPGSVGLGLAFCKMALDLHGGAVWVESDGAGAGSLFQFTLPVSDPREGGGS